MRASFCLLLWLLGASSLAQANEERHCNADVVLGRCKATQFGHNGVSMIGPTSTTCAALAWKNSWIRYGEDDSVPPKELQPAVEKAEVVTDDGVEMPTYGSEPVHQAQVEIQGCWALKIIKSRSDRPPKIDDAKTPVTYSCPESPPALWQLLPQLDRTGEVRIDPTGKQPQMRFFGAILRLVPHAASNYTAINHDFAVSIHKQTGAYTITLPDGQTLSGGCTPPHS
jgi:hypothetical protein